MWATCMRKGTQHETFADSSHHLSPACLLTPSASNKFCQCDMLVLPHPTRGQSQFLATCMMLLYKKLSAIPPGSPLTMLLILKFQGSLFTRRTNHTQHLSMLFYCIYQGEDMKRYLVLLHGFPPV